MKLRGLLVTVLLVLLPLSATANPDAVKEAFLSYKAAILSGDGTAAADLVTRSSRDFYRKAADHALTLDKTGLERLHVLDRLTVMQLRHEMSRAQLESMDGRQIVAYAVDQGWIGRDSAASLQVGTFAVDGDNATAPVISNGQETPLLLHFAREDGGWRLDLVQMMELSRPAVQVAIRQTGMSEEEFILYALEAVSGRRPGPEIWNPPS